MEEQRRKSTLLVGDVNDIVPLGLQSVKVLRVKAQETNGGSVKKYLVAC